MSNTLQSPAASLDFWKKCNICKQPIAYRKPFWVCNVSTCNRKRTGLVFCSTSCWDAHLPMMNHREAWAEERKAPSYDEFVKQLAEEAEPIKRERKCKGSDGDVEQRPADSVPVASAPKVIVRRKSD